ncbi:MAG: L-threonylcarbamoyladenylate synthase [Candidatus Woesearchaeota archaeon]|jgi:tRNA threonylcarbamoyl adenosine modification protein (Sua5/YciO/YrdC/YwlC family)|nr:L-threonylcarbamoyladenylate synthase [Candidatus Woesearchaeota archaeon]
MKIISKREFLAKKRFYVEEIIRGKIIIYPTDTIYGIGCSAKIGSSINKIREIKKRDSKPFSIIAPSRSWILENLKINILKIKYLKKLPGPFTFILDLKNDDCVSKDELIGESKSIGIRIPKCWFSSIILKSGVPFVTTSVNLSGEKYITKISEIKKEILKDVDYIIDCGKINTKPSTIINLVNDKIEIIKR